MDSHHAKTGTPRRRGRTVGPRPDPARVAAARRRLYEAGQTLTQWAAAHGAAVMDVSKVLSGKRACISGESHRIAVELGIKDGAPGE